MTAIALIALFAVLYIFIHESGHFIAAKIVGIQIKVFSIGTGKRICSFVLRGTEFRLSLLPIGGHIGMDFDLDDNSVPKWKKIFVFVGSSIAIFITGCILILIFVFMVIFERFDWDIQLHFLKISIFFLVSSIYTMSPLCNDGRNILYLLRK